VKFTAALPDSLRCLRVQLVGPVLHALLATTSWFECTCSKLPAPMMGVQQQAHEYLLHPTAAVWNFISHHPLGMGNMQCMCCCSCGSRSRLISKLFAVLASDE
jgi:muramidase (phage lysozyme)